MNKFVVTRTLDYRETQRFAVLASDADQAETFIRGQSCAGVLPRPIDDDLDQIEGRVEFSTEQVEEFPKDPAAGRQVAVYLMEACSEQAFLLLQEIDSSLGKMFLTNKSRSTAETEVQLATWLPKVRALLCHVEGSTGIEVVTANDEEA